MTGPPGRPTAVPPRLPHGARLAQVGTPRSESDSVVLVLPGGKPVSHQSARSWHLSNVRTQAVSRTVRRAAPSSAVYRLRYGVRGWNEPDRPALADGRHALAHLTDHHPGLPVVLVGHSMGARVAAALATHPAVVGVLALAPWWPDREADALPPSVRLVVVHGSADRWTDPRASRLAVQRARDNGLAADHHLIHSTGHFMLKRRQAWDSAITGALRRILESVAN